MLAIPPSGSGGQTATLLVEEPSLVALVPPHAARAKPATTPKINHVMPRPICALQHLACQAPDGKIRGGSLVAVCHGVSAVTAMSYVKGRRASRRA
jgi:hypothetical protein